MARIEEKKPHPFSKEWRALREAQQNGVVQATQESVAVEAKPVNQPDLSNVLERLERLEQENQELKAAKENQFIKAKERYEWPRKYSYKLWGWIPVLSYESYRKDPSKDLTFKNNFWHYESNHYLKLSLANGETVNAEVTEFNRDYTRSDYNDAELRTDNKGNILWYVFNDTTYWELLVSLSAIN